MVDSFKQTMKKKVLLKLLSLIICFYLCGCTNKQQILSNSNPEKFLSFDWSSLKDKVHTIKLSELMESIEIVKLDNSTEDAYTGIFKLEISDNYLVTSCPGGTPVKLFNRKNGHFIKNIGKRGQGPSEYYTIWNIMIDEERNRIHLGEPFSNEIYTYDMNGEYHAEESIFLPKGLENKYAIYIQKEENKAVVLNTPCTDYDKRNIKIKGQTNTCWIQDLKGNILDSIPFNNALSLPQGSSNTWASHVNKKTPIYSFALCPVLYERPDTLYHYNSQTNQLYPVYTPNTETALHIFTTSVETSAHYYTIQGFYKKGCGINPEYLEEWKIVQVEKETSKGKYIRLVNDLLGDIEIVSYDFFQNIKDNYTFIIYHPLDLKEQLEEALETNTDMSDEIRNRVLTMKNSLNENDNDILVICKFKQ